MWPLNPSQLLRTIDRAQYFLEGKQRSHMQVCLSIFLSPAPTTKRSGFFQSLLEELLINLASTTASWPLAFVPIAI